ncbi:stalk domain-containing protein [Paenibacillus sp. CAU 1782]
MKLNFGNITIMTLAFFTLIGALTNPRLPDDQYNRSAAAGQPVSLSIHEESAELPSALLQNYTSGETAAAPQEQTIGAAFFKAENNPSTVAAQAQAVSVSAAASPQVGLDVVHTAGRSFIPLRGYVEQHGGSLTYNAENATIDITIGEESFSLLLHEGTVMKNGYELAAHFFVQNGMTYISYDTAETLSFPETWDQKNG